MRESLLLKKIPRPPARRPPEQPPRPARPNQEEGSISARVPRPPPRRMRTRHDYPIGKPGVPWNDDNRRAWLESRNKHIDRDYHATMGAYIPSSSSSSSSSQCRNRDGRREIVGFVPIVYGTLAIKDGDDGNGNVNGNGGSSGGATPECYPLLAFVSEDATFLRIPSANDDDYEEEKTTMGDIGIYGDGGESKPAVLITGGVHGYETSGIFGALDFLTSGLARHYSEYFDVVVIPCVSPWGYEYNERWTANAIDPNRSFRRHSTKDDPIPPMRTVESSCLIAFLDGLGSRTTTSSSGHERTPRWLCHVDLHETTDTDVTEYRPARAARDGQLEYDDHIPDGFYLFGSVDDGDGEEVGVDDGEGGMNRKNRRDFYDAILAGVEGVGSHLAEMEIDGTLCGYRAEKRGLLLLSRSECADMGICAGGALPDVPYAVTTEVYPDSIRTSGEDCVKAQVGAICAALDFLKERCLRPTP
jgi:hypothetical protein